MRMIKEIQETKITTKPKLRAMHANKKKIMKK